MDQKLLREREARCVQENPPGCTAGCPVHVDVRGMLAAIRNRDYAAGFSLYSKQVPFPGIISRICDQPCRQGCKRRELDEAIAIQALEKICVDKNNRPAALAAPLPQRSQSVAVAGGGLSGLTAAYDLRLKGYRVVLFEASDRLGGSVRQIAEETLPRQVIEDDLAVFGRQAVEIHYNRPVSGLAGAELSVAALCEQFDAVYLSVGADGLPELAGLQAVDSNTLQTGQPKVFAGGSLRRGRSGWSPIGSIADGRTAALSIDRWLQGASLTANREKAGGVATTLFTRIDGVKPIPGTPVGAATGYTEAEALQEAGRCLQCECRECVKACEYLAHYGAYPKRYVREVYNNLSIVMGIHRANKMINSCSLCGLCEQICPNSLDMGEVCREARQMMVRRGKMPPSTHDFALRDMAYSNSEDCFLSRHQPGMNSSETVFYPGCQLAASLPQYIPPLYRFLTEKLDGGVGLMLGCCGAPANWAGREEVFEQTLRHMEREWQALGSPRIITACPTCFTMLRQNLPAAEVETLWTLLDRIGLPATASAGALPLQLAIHDSCTTRLETELHASVRSLTGKLGYQVEELPRSREHTSCCGYGGLMLYANREVAQKEVQRRIQESTAAYLTYCAMCRDNFAGQGKPAYHLLELILGVQPAAAARPGPGISERRQNRARLRRTLLQTVWGESVNETPETVKVNIPDDVKKIMEDRMILAEEATSVIGHAEATGDKFRDTVSGHFIAGLKIASVTYWVEYSAEEDQFLLHNVYSHRIEILE